MTARLDPSVLPWSAEAEQSVLGSLLLDNRASTVVIESGLRAEHFYDARHGTVFSATMVQIGSGRPADIVTVFAALGSKADEVGGLSSLNQLAQSVPSAANVRRYAEIVIEKALGRRIAAAADQALGIARGAGAPVDKLDRVASLFAAIRVPTASAGPQSVSAVIAERSAHWQALAEGTTTPGTPTHLPTLDSALGGGPKAGKVLVIASRPSVGKTSLASDIALAFGKAGKPVLFLSQEMTAGELIDRFVSNEGRISLEAITTGRFDDEVTSRLVEASDQIGRLPVFIDDTPALTLADIRAKARQVQQRNGLGLLVLDYLQLARDDGGATHRHHQIEQISRGMKQLAKELNCAVIVLSQINRSSLQRQDGEPTLADLKESGAIEEDADAVLLLHPRDQSPDGSLLVVGILAKNRQGRRGRIALRFEGATQRWSESTVDVSRRGGQQQ